MLRFSRYFLILFFLITVIPVAAILLWDQVNLHSAHQARQQLALSVGAQSLGNRQERLLEQETERTLQAVYLMSVDTPLSRVKTSLHATGAWWFKAHTFVGDDPLPDKLKDLVDYFPTHQQADQQGGVSYFEALDAPHDQVSLATMLPLPNGPYDGLLVVHSVPLHKLTPIGPYQTSIFSGTQTDDTHQIVSLSPPHQHDRRGRGRQYRQKQRLKRFEQQRRKMLAHGPSLNPANPANHADQADQALSPETPMPNSDTLTGATTNPSPASSPPLPLPPNGPSTQVVITDHTNQPVATVVLHLAKLENEDLSLNPWQAGGMKKWLSLVILVTTVLGSLLAGHYLKRNFVDPVLRLSMASQAVGHGNLKTRVETDDVKQADMARTLAAFNTMVEGLQEKEALRRNFIANLTHDFRTPLIAQHRSLDLLAEEFKALSMPEQEKLAASMRRNNEHLLGMVNQLLDVYKLEAGQLQLSPHPIDLSALVGECLEQVTSMASQRQITLETDLADPMPAFHADEKGLKRVLLNLLANALENIPAQSTVTLSADTDGSVVHIRVHDNGPGIPPAEQALLFDRYS
ncbi:MAG: HAMP domain-containing histidine kinase, partial [Cyanobacteria bacterium HKST-UBA03]|nr:HAMP domain-containing histidine kinase [Cyanobacteria bacterium HKST-UBA03]